MNLKRVDSTEPGLHQSRPRNPAQYGVAWTEGRCVVDDKVRYATVEDALTELAHTLTKAINGNGHRQESGMYPCGSCEGWHLTSHPRADEIVYRGEFPRTHQL